MIFTRNAGIYVRISSTVVLVSIKSTSPSLIKEAAFFAILLLFSDSFPFLKEKL